MSNEVASTNLESVGKGKPRRCLNVAILRSKNRGAKPKRTKVTIKKVIKK